MKSSAKATTRTMRVKDNAGNWSNWADHTVTVDLAARHHRADRHDLVPTNWRRATTTVTVSAADDIDGKGIDYVEWRVDGNPVQRTVGSTFTVSTDGVHEIETRAWDKAGNTSDWRTQTLKIDKTLPTDTTTMPATGPRRARSRFERDRRDLRRRQIEYKVDGPSPSPITAARRRHAPGDGAFTIEQRVYDVAGQQPNLHEPTYKADTVIARQYEPASPTAWQTTRAVAALAGTDAGGSGVDHAEWRVGCGDPRRGPPRWSRPRARRAADAGGRQGRQRLGAASGDGPCRPHRAVQRHPAVRDAGARPNYATTVAGTDATSGVDRSSSGSTAAAPPRPRPCR